MKKLLLLTFLFASFIASSQNNNKKPFFSGSLSSTFAINPNYTITTNEDGEETLLQPASILLRIGFGYQLNNHWLVSFNTGYDHHLRFGINAIPTFGKLTYNITENDGNTFFVSSSLGKMWRPSPRFEDGNYYGFGVGWKMAGDGKWSTILKIDFHRKKIADFKKGNLDSISLGVGIRLF